MSQPTNAQKYFQLGQKACEEGKYDEASAYFDKCIQIQNDYADAYYWWGKALYSLEKYEEAAEKFTKSMELDSTYKADAYYWWASISYKFGDRSIYRKI